MEFRLEHQFSDYIDHGNETTQEILESGSSLVAAIEKFYAFFRDDLWVGDVEMSPTQAFLSMNAFLLYMSAIRMALTGHQAATFPLFRTALESACYAFLEALTKPSLDEFPADHDTGQGEERLVDVGTPFVAHGEAAELREPSQCALDHPAMAAEMVAAFDTAAGDAVADAPTA